MLPTINGKPIIDCNINDLIAIIDNPAYAEDEHLDYKKTFAIDAVDKSQKQHEIEEFRNDVCSFANSSGGYLIFGIDEKKGIPFELVGITIKGDNRDTFERNIKNYLQSILPQVPHFQLHFLQLPNNRYIIIMLIHNDYFAPYIHLSEQKNYKIYKRVGNSKSCVGYQELKRMFTQSMTLEKEIERYRKERIDLFYDKEAAYHKERFMLLHLIPETFLDSSYNKPIFYHYRKGARFSSLFAPFGCMYRPLPTVSGIRYADSQIGVEGRLQDNGIAEVFFPLQDTIDSSGAYPDGFLPSLYLWELIESFTRAYAQINDLLTDSVRVFAGLSIVGCKNVKTDNDWLAAGSIDRHMLICEPVTFENMADEEQLEYDIKKFKLEMLLSLGVHSTEEVKKLLSDVYEQE